MRTLGEEHPEEEDSTFAEVCHSVILGYRGPGGQDYEDFHQSIMFLFGSVLQSSGGHFEGSPFQKVLVSHSTCSGASCRQINGCCCDSSRRSTVSLSLTDQSAKSAARTLLTLAQPPMLLDSSAWPAVCASVNKIVPIGTDELAGWVGRQFQCFVQDL